MAEEAQKYRITFKCSCGRTFKKLTTNPDLEKVPCPECKKKDKKTKLFKIGDGPVPSTETVADHFIKPKVFPNTIYKCRDCSAILKVYEDIGETNLTECYACGSSDIHFRGKISHDVTGQNAIQNKAIDKTAEIVMDNYGMTDLRDNVRPGEAMAPKLAPHLQNGADNFFGGRKGSAMPKNVGNIAKRAMQGSFRNGGYIDPVGALHDSEKKAGGRTGVTQ